MTDHLTLLDDTSTATSGWRFSVIPPKHVWVRWLRTLKTLRRPGGSLALPAIATTATLHFTDVLQHSDSLMALGLTTLAVGYDAVIVVCRTWQKTTAQPQQATTTARRTA
ncbi:hypothetical protein AB0H69_14260 [Streptomyces phaeochromogenes]|uniref:hypothetical protein n=1 Tax=Streptomyces phaeochromogenes TaxID=1923 RepID=UPI0033D72BF3